MNPISLPPSVTITEHAEGLTRLDISTPLATASLYLYGAQVASFTPTGERPVLFFSKASYFTPGKPMRGGCPVIFPWFGPHPSDSSKPAHGFARNREWTLESAIEAADGLVEIVLRLDPDADAALLWPEAGNQWVLRHRVTIGRVLTMELEIQNLGETSISFEDALHTYFAISDIHETEVVGLENTEYLTIIEDQHRKNQGASSVRFTGETDRVYLNTENRILIKEALRSIVIEKEGAASVVVWNPWVEKAASLLDMQDNEWPEMLCVETGNAKENRIDLPGGKIHRSVTRVSVES